MVRWCLVAFATFIVAISYSLACPAHFCDRVTCDPPPECGFNQVLGPKGECGCCRQCITLLYEGDPCTPSVYDHPTPNTKCADGLVCVDHICRRQLIKTL